MIRKKDGPFMMEGMYFILAQMELGIICLDTRLFTNEDFEVYDKLVFKSNQTVFQVIFY